MSIVGRPDLKYKTTGIGFDLCVNPEVGLHVYF